MISLAALRKDLIIVAAVVGALVSIAGVLVNYFSTGPLHELGTWAAVAASALGAVLIVVKQVQQLVSLAATAPAVTGPSGPASYGGTGLS